MSTYAALIREDIRLSILRALNEDADYSHNESILKGVLGAVGHKISSDRLRTELGWLAEQNLITTEDVAGLTVARLTDRGQDAATGAAVVPGVKRPGPGM